MRSLVLRQPLGGDNQRVGGRDLLPGGHLVAHLGDARLSSSRTADALCRPAEALWWPHQRSGIEDERTL